MFQIKYLGSTINIEKNSCITIKGNVIDIKELHSFDDDSSENRLADALGEVIHSQYEKLPRKQTKETKKQNCLAIAFRLLNENRFMASCDIYNAVEVETNISRKYASNIFNAATEIKKYNGIWSLN